MIMKLIYNDNRNFRNWRKRLKSSPSEDNLTFWYIIHTCVCVCSVMSDSLRPHGLWPARLFCPWNFPGKNTGVGCCFLSQGIFLTQGSNLPLLHWQADSLLLYHLGNPLPIYTVIYNYCKYSVNFPFKLILFAGIFPYL